MNCVIYESSNIFKSFLRLFCNLENEANPQHIKFSKIHLNFCVRFPRSTESM